MRIYTCHGDPIDVAGIVLLRRPPCPQSASLRFYSRPLAYLFCRTDVELSTIHARASHHPDEPVTPTVTMNDDRESLRKSLKMVETGPADLEGSHTGDIPLTAAPALTPASRRKARIQFVTLCWSLFLAGWNDGTTGPLLPRIQLVYHVCHIPCSPLYPTRGTHLDSLGWIRCRVPHIRLQLHRECRVSLSSSEPYLSSNTRVSSLVQQPTSGLPTS